MSKYEPNRTLVNLAVTPGEPAGIGPDLCLKSYRDLADHIQPVYFSDPELLRERAKLLGISASINDWSVDNEYVKGEMNVFPISLRTPCEAGKLDALNSPYVLETLKSALDCCQAGTLQAMVTGPVNKAIINDAGLPFSGHTEWLAEHTGTSTVVMMLASGNLRVALATTHLPLRSVPDAINRQSLKRIIQVIMAELKSKFGIDQPRLLVCGLNPHAGESGHIGTEEIDVIIPVLKELTETGLDIEGPVPADTAFTAHKLSRVDAVLAMYHDQGLPVLKSMGFGEAVNITLGLPIIRTSVDHGTALELAGSGEADSGSLICAIQCASELVTKQTV